MDPRNFDADLMSEMFSAMGKELKLARAKIKSLESQDYKTRAESAEYALGILKKNFEDVCSENRQLRTTLEEMKDSKVWVKKETIEDADQALPPPRETNHFEKIVSTEPVDTDHVQDLEKALETYYRKYKEQKEAKQQLRETCRELEENLLKSESDLKQAKGVNVSKLSIGVQTAHVIRPPVLTTATPSVLTSREEVCKFMADLPSPINSFRPQKWMPVCKVSMDLKAFLAAQEDPRCKEVGTNLLCLPGRVIWCDASIKQHALAVAPLSVYDPSKQAASRNMGVFDGLLGKTFHLFFTGNGSIYYAGLYKAVDLHSRNPGGIAVSGSDLSWKVLTEATLQSSRAPNTARLLEPLYKGGMLKVQVLGLQYLECDKSIYEMLTNRFASYQSALKPVDKLGGYYPEAMQEEQPKRKKRKTVS